MDKEIMWNRLIDLSKKEIDLVELMNLTIYNVKREIEVNSQNNFQIHYWLREPFNNKEANSQHILYRSDEGEAYEILSLLIRMEKPRSVLQHSTDQMLKKKYGIIRKGGNRGFNSVD